jgi:hypothetical protein
MPGLRNSAQCGIREGYKSNRPPQRRHCLSFARGLELRIFPTSIGLNALNRKSFRAGYESEVIVAVFRR